MLFKRRSCSSSTFNYKTSMLVYAALIHHKLYLILRIFSRHSISPQWPYKSWSIPSPELGMFALSKVHTRSLIFTHVFHYLVNLRVYPKSLYEGFTMVAICFSFHWTGHYSCYPVLYTPNGYNGSFPSLHSLFNYSSRIESQNRFQA